MSKSPDVGGQLEPFGQDPELTRLLSAERGAPDPDPVVRDRVWARLSGTLMTPPVPQPPRSMVSGKLMLIATTSVGVVAALVWWRTPAPSRDASVPPPSIVVTAPVPTPGSTLLAQTAAAPPSIDVPAPSAPLDRDEGPRRARRPLDTLGAERELVDRAREALAHGDPRAAAQALDEHARRFARGQLAEERESLAIRAELTLGRPADARARVERFLRAHPDSLFAPVVRALGVRARSALPDEPTP